MESKYNIRRIIIFGLIIIGAVFILVLAWHFLTTGKIIITTSNPNNIITLTKNDDSDKKKPAKAYTAHSQLSKTLAKGEYFVSVEGNSVATTQIVEVKGHKTQTYDINPLNTTGIEPVAYKNAQNVAVNSNKLVFLDSSAGSIFSIDQANNVSTMPSSVVFKTVKWLNPLIGLGKDSNGRIYQINNGSASPISVPFTYSGKSIDFDLVSPNQVYVSNGADLYAGSLSGGFKKIYTATSSSPVISAGSGIVAVADERGEQNSQQESVLATITTSGKTLKKSVEAGALAWSTNGSYLASAEESGVDIYDSSLREVANVPTHAFVGHMRWLNNNDLLYATADELWIYNLSSQKAELLANMTLGAAVSEITPNQDGSYVYIVSEDQDGGRSIKRIGLKGQATSDYIFKLQSIMPLSLDNYSLSLINFGVNNTPPAVLVHPYSSTASNSPYLQAAKTELLQRGFNISQLQFKLESSSGD
jgi:hypothetical protein